MTTTASFVLCAVLLTALALAFVLPTLLRALPPPVHGADTTSTGGPALPAKAWPAAIGLLVGVPALAAAVYAGLGTPAGWRAGPTPAAANAAANASATTAANAAAPAPPTEPVPGPAQIEAMVQRLADKLAAEPDDPAGWRMLARSYETLGRFGDATRAYVQLERLRPADAGVLTDHAVALAMSQGQRLTGAPERLIDRALQLDPGQVQALALSGSAAFERGDHARAAVTWRKILALVPADDPLARTMEDSIRQAEALGRAPRPTPSAPAGR